MEFVYKSFRDNSKLFKLDVENLNQIQNKYFIKLHLKLNIYPSNDGTQKDLEKERESYYLLNRLRDTHIETWETFSINNFTEYNLVSVSENTPFFVNWFFYIIFVFLGFVELYKQYLDTLCITQNFEISKEFSSKRNISLPINNAENEVINNSNFVSDPSNLSFHSNNQYQVYNYYNSNNSPSQDLPTEEEINSFITRNR
jgi:hypothetical protein